MFISFSRMHVYGLVLAAAMPCFAASDRTVSVTDAFNAAVHTSETIAIQGEQIKQAGEHEKQAMGAVLPTVNANAAYFKQQSGKVPESVSPSWLPLIKLTATQPLFRGFRDFDALHQMKTLTRAQGEARRLAIKSLYDEVLQNYLLILSLERDLVNLGEESTAYEKRIEELNARIRIGRSRQTERLTVESTLASLRANIEQSKGQLAAARQMFAFLTGMSVETKLQDSAIEAKFALLPVDHYLAKIESRPDVQNASLQVKAATEALDIAYEGHYPTVDLSGNYYAERTGTLQNVTWDVTLAVTVPIYSGGITNSKVAEAASQKAGAEFALTKARRAADEEIRALYQSAAADLLQVAELKNSRILSKQNLDEQLKDYRVGLVNNLDVLQAITNAEETKRALDRAHFSSRLDYHRLLNAAQLVNETAAVSSSDSPQKRALPQVAPALSVEHS